MDLSLWGLTIAFPACPISRDTSTKQGVGNVWPILCFSFALAHALFGSLDFVFAINSNPQ